MANTTKLELRQTHSLVMTPQLQQAIKLLQLSNMELASFVETELERDLECRFEFKDSGHGEIQQVDHARLGVLTVRRPRQDRTKCLVDDRVNQCGLTLKIPIGRRP